MRASVQEARVVKVVKSQLAGRADADVELTGRLNQPRLRSLLVVLAPGDRRNIAFADAAGPMFLFVLAGRLRLQFGDGDDETLDRGDALHLEARAATAAIWTNPFRGSARVLCIVDPGRTAG